MSRVAPKAESLAHTSVGQGTESRRPTRQDARESRLKALRITAWVLLALTFLPMQGCLILPVPVPHPRLHAYGVEGRIVDEDGKPVPNVKVVSPEQKEEQSRHYVRKREAVTDSDGYFKIKSAWGWHGAYVMVLLAPCGAGNHFSTFPQHKGAVWQADNKIHFFADGFPEQKFTPYYWRSPLVKDLYNQRVASGYKDKAYVEDSTVYANEIMLHRQTTSNYLAAATYEHATNKLKVTSILLFGKDVRRVITDTNLIAAIVSEMSVPAEMTTHTVPSSAFSMDVPRDDILCFMVFHANRKPMHVGHVVKHDGTILNNHISWWDGGDYDQNGWRYSQNASDITWRFRSEAIADLVREVLSGNDNGMKGER